jgi:membrane protease YdiL (CAAX protease family)
MYTSAILSHAVLVVPTFLFDLAGSRAGIHLVLRKLSLPAFSLWTLGTVAVCVTAWLVMLIEARRHPEGSDRIVLALLPRTRKELIAFLGISLAAGFAEEYLLRGFCLGLVTLATGSIGVAVALTTLSFGLAHLYQGPRGAMRATVLGAVLAAPVAFTGSVVPSMIAHAAMDMISGCWTLPILRHWGVAAE